MKFPTKIPTIVGLFLVVLVIGGLVFVSERLFRGPTVATDSIRPSSVEMTNVTDASVTVTWVTSAPATGMVEMRSKTGKKTTTFDERDTSRGKQTKYQTHMVTVRSLLPDTSYEVTVFSNAKAFTNNGKPWQVITAPAIGQSSSTLEPAYGTITATDGSPTEGALVSLTLEGGQTFSALTNKSGSWLVPLNLTRTSDLSRFLPTAGRITETIMVRYNDEETTAITDTLNDGPVPDMRLGKTYDFRKVQAKAEPDGGSSLASLPTPPASGAVLGDTTVPVPYKVSLVSPAQGATLTSTLPLIQGTGFPGKFVAITLGITKPIGGSAKVGTDGLWRYTPAKALAPGKQSVTATTQDDKGKSIAITHTFEILKSGTQVLGDATPSATLAPTITLEPTLEPFEPSTLAGEPVPTSGNTLPTLLLLMAGLLLFSGGVVALAL